MEIPRRVSMPRRPRVAGRAAGRLARKEVPFSTPRGGSLGGVAESVGGSDGSGGAGGTESAPVVAADSGSTGG